ncbi:death-inducer obliterator 1 isoform b [Camelus ferus]|nr:death-inducer obliterator 1 isoform b [Camelus ferus]
MARPAVGSAGPQAVNTGELFWAGKEDRRTEEKTVVAAAVPKRTGPLGSLGGGKQPSPRNLVPKKSPPFAGTAVGKAAIRKLPLGLKGASPKRRWLSAAPAGSAPATKPAGLAPSTATSAPRQFPGSAASAGAARKPGAAAVPLASPAPGRLGTSSAAPSQPNSQIRQNIRRSLKEILWKRVSDSDDLVMTENEVGKIALHIEKEMFNLFRVTDNRYKSKYRSIMFNLKDPKNQVMESRTKLHNESKKPAAKQEAAPDLEDSPPVSDSEEQQESARAAPERSPAPPLDVFSSMLKDTTSQHRAHLFDLNCKICTGQAPVAEDEPAPKKQRLSASAGKEEPKPKHASAPSEPALSSAGEAAPEALPDSTSEPGLQGEWLPAPPGDGHPEASTLGDTPCPASCGGGVLTTVTVSGRDPRTAPGGPCAVSAPAAARPDSAPPVEPRQDILKPAVASVTVPKSILAKPSASPEPRYLLSVTPSPSVRCGLWVWPGELGSVPYLGLLRTLGVEGPAVAVTRQEDLRGVRGLEGCRQSCLAGGAHRSSLVAGRLCPGARQLSGELCLIRFHPATEEEEVAYISLYSYFSSRGRFGVVANNSRHVKDLYLIPLSARDPVPSKLLPFEGPDRATRQTCCLARPRHSGQDWGSGAAALATELSFRGVGGWHQSTRIISIDCLREVPCGRRTRSIQASCLSEPQFTHSRAGTGASDSRAMLSEAFCSSSRGAAAQSIAHAANAQRLRVLCMCSGTRHLNQLGAPPGPDHDTLLTCVGLRCSCPRRPVFTMRHTQLL